MNRKFIDKRLSASLLAALTSFALMGTSANANDKFRHLASGGYCDVFVNETEKKFQNIVLKRLQDDVAVDKQFYYYMLSEINNYLAKNKAPVFRCKATRRGIMQRRIDQIGFTLDLDEEAEATLKQISKVAGFECEKKVSLGITDPAGRPMWMLLDSNPENIMENYDTGQRMSFDPALLDSDIPERIAKMETIRSHNPGLADHLEKAAERFKALNGLNQCAAPEVPRANAAGADGVIGASLPDGEMVHLRNTKQMAEAASHAADTGSNAVSRISSAKPRPAIGTSPLDVVDVIFIDQPRTGGGHGAVEGALATGLLLSKIPYSGYVLAGGTILIIAEDVDLKANSNINDGRLPVVRFGRAYCGR